MKTISLPVSLKNLLVVAGLAISSATYSQTIPELIFRNPTLVPNSAAAGQNGAQYRFSNVATGLDAVLEIRDRSSSSVIVSSIDSTGIGWDKALQPVVGIPGNIGANQNWWMKFRLTFYKAGTNEKKKITKFHITGIDIDGDGGGLQEWVQMDKVTSVSFSPVNHLLDNLLGILTDILDFNNNGEDHKITGPIANYTNIDTAATGVMATYQYDNKDKIEFYLGGKTNSSGTPAGIGMRMNSLWFKQFNLNLVTLPVKLTDFTAKYNNTNVLLTWTTAAEMSFSHYELEHSTDAVNYSTTALVFGAGMEGRGATYNYKDNVNGRGGIIYYRLKMVDIDGRITYSSVRIVRLGDEKKTITLTTYPNPVVSDLRVTLPAAWQGKEVAIELYNANGQRVKGIKTSNSSQTETMPVADLKKGVFFVKAVCGNEVANQTIIKN